MLLNSLSAGFEVEKPTDEDESNSKVRAYDFKTANKFTKEQIRTLNIVFRNFGQLLSNYLTGVLRTPCDVETLSLEEITFNEFNNSLPSPLIIAIVEMSPLSGSVILQLTKEVSYSIISRIFGGSSTASVTSKQFTEIELAIMERMIKQILRYLDQAWTKVFAVRSRLDRIETSIQFAQIVELNEPVAVITFKVSIGSENGIISMCLPYQGLEPVAKQLNARLLYTGAQTKKITTQPENIIGKIKNTDINITAVFHETHATVADITNLRIGDVIQLDHKVGQPIIIKLQNIPKFHGIIGSQGLKSAAKIVDIIKGEENDE